MSIEIRVFETPTAETFFPRGYLLANPDLMKTLLSSETAAKVHFNQFGRHQGKRQLTPEYVEWSASADRKAERFRRFAGCFASLPAKSGNSRSRSETGLRTLRIIIRNPPTAPPVRSERKYSRIPIGFTRISAPGCAISFSKTVSMSKSIRR